MKLIEKENALGVRYRWIVEEIKDEDDVFRLIEKVATIGELNCIEFHGYEDMDEHTNWAVFESVEEFKEGIKDLPKIGPDEATVRLYVDKVRVIVLFYYKKHMPNGAKMSLICSNESVGKKVAQVLEQKVREVAR